MGIEPTVRVLQFCTVDSASKNCLQTAASLLWECSCTASPCKNPEKFSKNGLPPGTSRPFQSYWLRSGICTIDIGLNGNRFIGYVLSWGLPMLGHAYLRVVQALGKAAARGTSYGVPSPLEVELAGLVQQFIPNFEILCFVN